MEKKNLHHITTLFDRCSLDAPQAHKIARYIGRILDLPVIAVYDLANEPDPENIDPGWARHLLGDGWVIVFEGVPA